MIGIASRFPSFIQTLKLSLQPVIAQNVSSASKGDWKRRKQASAEAPKVELWYVWRLRLNCAFCPGDTYICKDLDDDDVAMGSPDYDPNRNAHLKGRRRFNADLADIQEASLLGFFLHGLKLQSMSVISTARHHILTETSRGCGRRRRRIIGDHHSRQLIQACPHCKFTGFRLAIFLSNTTRVSHRL